MLNSALTWLSLFVAVLSVILAQRTIGKYKQLLKLWTVWASSMVANSKIENETLRLRLRKEYQSYATQTAEYVRDAGSGE
jgi:protein-S-isoprenylcysteine O-methyltransferase Ste14